MDFDELLVTTGVDKLVRLVREKQKVELELASNILKLDTEQVEDWARILDEEGIIRIDYHLTKVYLTWVKPDEKQIEEQKASLESQKKVVESQVSKLRSSIEPDVKELEDLRKGFDLFYEKIQPRLSKIEKLLDNAPDVKSIFEKKYGEQKGKNEELKTKIDNIRESHQMLKEEVEQIKGEISGRQSIDLNKIEELKKEMSNVRSEITLMEQKIENAKNIIPKEIGKLEVDKKVAELRTEFKDLIRQNSKIREEMSTLSETSEIAESVSDAIEKHEEKTKDLRSEMQQMLKEIEKIHSRSADVLAKIKNEVEVVDRFADSIDVAKDIMKKFPSHKDVIKKITALQKKEKDLEDKIDAMEKIMHNIGEPLDLIKEFKNLQKQASDIRNNIMAESDEIFRAVEEEGSTYMTYQKIKEKALSSLESYSKQLTELEKEIKNVNDDFANSSKKTVEEYKQQLKSQNFGELEPVIKELNEVNDKKQMLDSIKEKIDSAYVIAGNLSRKLNIVAKQAEMLSIRTGDMTLRESEEFTNAVKLTRDEEEEFRKKRQELKDLIKKLWEDS